MVKKKTKAKRGPGKPKTIISDADMAKAEEYAFQGCQNGTIAGLMGWDEEWLHQRKDILKPLMKKRQERKLSLRRAQNVKALQGRDTAMLIFLGKNDLGQADKVDTNHDVGDRLASLMKEIGSGEIKPPD